MQYGIHCLELTSLQQQYNTSLLDSIVPRSLKEAILGSNIDPYIIRSGIDDHRFTHDLYEVLQFDYKMFQGAEVGFVFKMAYFELHIVLLKFICNV